MPVPYDAVRDEGIALGELMSGPGTGENRHRTTAVGERTHHQQLTAVSERQPSGPMGGEVEGRLLRHLVPRLVEQHVTQATLLLGGVRTDRHAIMPGAAGLEPRACCPPDMALAGIVPHGPESRPRKARNLSRPD